MKKFYFLTRILILCFLTVFLALASLQTASAQERQSPKLGLYIEIPFYYNMFAGDFDGDHYFDTGFELIMVPNPESNYGYGIVVGRRLDQSSVEFGYVQSSHDYTFLDHQDKMTLSLFLMGAKAYVTRNKIIQPYISGEFAVAYLKVKKGAVTEIEPYVFKDTSFLGLTLGAGGGISFHPLPPVSLNIGAVFSWLTFGSVRVSGERYKLDSLNSLNFNLRAGLSYTF